MDFSCLGWGRTKLTSCFQREKLEKTSLFWPYFNVFGGKKGEIKTSVSGKPLKIFPNRPFLNVNQT